MKFQCLVTIDYPDIDGFSEARLTKRHVIINEIMQAILSRELDNGTFDNATSVTTRRFIP